jgi:hypothetical protein
MYSKNFPVSPYVNVHNECPMLVLNNLQIHQDTQLIQPLFNILGFVPETHMLKAYDLRVK